MDLMELCHGIGLSEEAVNKIDVIRQKNKMYEDMKHLFKNNRDEFYKILMSKNDTELSFLYYYCQFACDTYEAYKKRGIEDKIFWDTFLDIRIWSDDYFRKTGKCGLDYYVHDWFWRALELKLFRLGRLEFEEMKADEEIQGINSCIKKGESVISIHIPEGDPLTPEVCQEALEKAYHWFGKERQYFCHSWLLFPELRKLLPQKSNILLFQDFFDIKKVDYREREAELRIFGETGLRVINYAEETSLQKHAKQFLLSGGSLGNGWGILKK